MMDEDVQAKLAVLDEIKSLMDTRLGDSMSPKPEDGLSVEKVTVSADEDMMSPEDEDELMEMYSGM